MANEEQTALSVDATDEMTIAIQEAKARVAQVDSRKGKTLISQISADDWAAWDASHECALVQEPAESEDLDLYDEPHMKAAL